MIKSWDTYENTFALTIAQNNLETKVISLPMRGDYAKILSHNLYSNMELILQMQGIK